MSEKFLMSKSKFLTYKSCPFKFSLQYIDLKPEPRNKYSELSDQGTDIHKQIEDFYTKDLKIIEEQFKVIKENGADAQTIMKQVVKMDKEKYKKNIHMKHFIEFNENLVKGIEIEGKGLSYLFPINQEIDYYNNELKIHGVIDAVYQNYEDDGIIIMDWKSGKIKDISAMREEMAFYALCYNGDEKNKGVKVKYWGMFFTKFNYLFLEEIKEDVLTKVEKEIACIQNFIELKQFPKPFIKSMCGWCGYCNNECQ